MRFSSFSALRDSGFFLVSANIYSSTIITTPLLIELTIIIRSVSILGDIPGVPQSQVMSFINKTNKINFGSKI